MAKYTWFGSIYGSTYGPDSSTIFGRVDGNGEGWLFTRRLNGQGDVEAMRERVEFGVEEAERTLFKPVAPAIALPAGWVAHAPHLAERTADHMVVVCEREGYYRYSGGLASGTGTKTANTLHDACAWLDEALSPSPWQQTGAGRWVRSDDVRVQAAGESWWVYLGENFRSTTWFVNAEQARVWADKKRPL